jgi:membrane-bound serine protease (ClpP class)
LEETVTRALSYSGAEAVEMNVVDFIAEDIADLLAKVDGKTAQTAAGEVVLRTREAGVREIKRTLLNNFLGVLANPNLAFALFVIGGIALMVEITSPGFIGPGVIGVILLALAFLGFGNLPVNWVMVGLLLFSMALFYMETVAPGTSIFGMGGVVCLVLGGFLLFGGLFSTPSIPEPSLRVSPWIIAAFSGIAAASLFGFMRLARRDGGAPSGFVSPSDAALEEEWGVAASDLAPSGTVWVADKEWTATTDDGDVIREGVEVRVLGVYGDVLKVERLYADKEIEDSE